MESTGLPRPEITARLTDTSSWMAKYRQAHSPGVALLRPYGNLVAHDPRWFPKLLTLNSRLRTSPMVTVTSGPERWLLSETRRTPVQTPVRAGVRASSLEKSARSRLERDSRGKFVSAKRAEANDAAPKAASGASAPELSTTRIIAPRATVRYGSATRRGNTLSVDLGYDAFPKQQEFHESPAKYRLFGGAAGPGKSKALLMEAILQAHETPGAQTLLLRRTFPELEQSLLYYFRRDVPRELYKSFNESKHVVEWQNGSTTRFGYCQNESDVYQYQGAEFLFIGIDELTLFTLRQWQFLTSRNRCPVPGSFPCMAAATNPGNIGHAWVKSLWIDRQAPSGMENPDAYDPADYDFIPARVSDNPIYARDENYLKTLRALPSHLRRAFLDGDWDVFAGQYFDKFDYSRPVARAEQIDWKPWWPRWISIDWGFEHPSAAYWHAAIPPGSTARVLHGVSSVGTQHAVPGADAWRGDARSATAPPSSRSSLRDERPLFVSLGCLGAKPKRDPSGESGLQVRCQDSGGVHRTPETGDDGAVNGHVAVDGKVSPSTFAGPACRPPAGRAGTGGHSSAAPLRDQQQNPRSSAASTRDPSAGQERRAQDDDPNRIVTYREYVTHRTPPRELARQIVERSKLNSRHSERSEESLFVSPGCPEAQSKRDPSGKSGPQVRCQDSGGVHRTPETGDDGAREGNAEREHIDAIYLSPDAFARRTDEASIADQMGDVFVAAGFPRPIPADNDRVGGWMLMYQMLEAGEWLLTDNCIELIRTLPNLVRDPARIEDVEKMDGDDPADAARYGLKSRYGAHHGGSGARMPLAARLAERVTSADPTVRAIQARKAQVEESRRTLPVSFVHRPRR